MIKPFLSSCIFLLSIVASIVSVLLLFSGYHFGKIGDYSHGTYELVLAVICDLAATSFYKLAKKI